MKTLKPDSGLYKELLKLESIMDDMGVSIKSHGTIYLDYKGTEFKIGRDSDQFPRYVDEPFILME